MVLGQTIGLKPDTPRAPRWAVNAQAGPSKAHRFSRGMRDEFEYGIQDSHRQAYVKEITARANSGVRRMMGIEQNDESWHVVHAAGGTDAITKSVLALCPPDEISLVIKTGGFSQTIVDILEGTDKTGKHKDYAKRPTEVIDLTGEEIPALVPETDMFERVARMVESGDYPTICLTGNATTTGVNQNEAIKELRRRRDAAVSRTVIFDDSTSNQMIGAERSAESNADVTTYGGQKDIAIGGTNKSTIVVNDMALSRMRALGQRGVYIGGKESIPNDVDKKGNQSVTTPSVFGIAREAEVLAHFRGDGVELWREVGEMQSTVRDNLIASASEGELAELGYAFANKDSRVLSPTANVIDVPEDIDAAVLVGRLRKKHKISIGGGYGKANKNRQIRPCAYSANLVAEFGTATAAIVAETRVMRAAA